ncbi:MAG: hypothetical protein H6667_02510 [Ardenticatenaceae bacterium]|nr:hypothetical protein [Ardenticatenaceae bacterium]
MSVYDRVQYSFWLIVVSLLMFVVFSGLLWFLYEAGERSPAPYIFFGILTIFFLFSATVIVITINSPNVKTTTGILTKSIKVVRIRYVKTPRPFLHMDNKTYRTDPSIWYAIDPGKTYTIWYLPSFFSNNENQGKVIAYEPDAPQFPKIGDKYLTSSAKKPRSKIKTNIIVGVMIGAIAIFSQFYKTRKRRM